VVDELHEQPLFAEALDVIVADCAAPVRCTQQSVSSFNCELPGSIQLEPRVGNERIALQVSVRVNGEEQRAQAELLIDDNALERGHLCSYDGRVAVPLPTCAKDDAVAVEGQVLGLATCIAPRVRLWPAWRSDGIVWDLPPGRDCEVEGAMYRCPASGYRSQYVLEASVGSEIVAERSVYVQTDGCVLQTLRYDLEVAPAECELEVWLGTDARASAGVASVTLDATDAEPAMMCRRSELAAHLFRCPLSAGARMSARMVTFETREGLTLSKAKPTWRGTCPAVFPMRSSTIPPELGVPTVALRHPDLRALALFDE
jgi:hypothetical protein